jgi:cell division protein ZapA (FtsZ GTPase activity inhibitor)
MDKRQLKIELLGTSFVIQSDESPEHLADIAAYLKNKVEEVKGRYSFADPLTVALLVALNVTDELYRAREGRLPADPPEEIGRVAQRLIDTIDDELLQHTPYESKEPS